MLNYGAGPHIHMTFQIDGSVDLDDRQHLLDLYSGIPFGSPVPDVGEGRYIPVIRPRRRK